MKLNLGSGAKPLEGWENYDHNNGHKIYPLDLSDNSAEVVRCSHALEHFPQNQAITILKDWARVLKPGGWLKIAVPNFDWIAKEYLEGNSNGLPIFAYLMGSQVDENDYHKAVFNQATLNYLLEQAGLTDIQPWTSEIDDCAALPVSLNLMGRKPEACSGCGATDGRLLEDVCCYCHPRRQQIHEEWDERVSSFLGKARGLIRLGANDGAQREVYGRYGLPVIWVEALPDVHLRLAENIAGYPNHRALNYLLTDEDGKEYDFGVASNEAKSSSIFAFADHKRLWPKIHYTRSVKLKSTTFKTMVEAEKIDLSSYDALIMDIQGAELKALKGMGDLLDGFQWVLSEAADFEIYKDCCQLKDLDEYLIPRGFVRVELFKAVGMRGLGHVYDVLYRQGPIEGEKDFVAGQWRPRSELIKDSARVRSGVVMSTPRHGPLDSAECIFEIAAELGAPRFKTTGCWRYQGRGRSVEATMAFGSEGKREWEEELSDAFEDALAHEGGLDVFITADYDTFATPADAKELIKLLYQNPQYDCIVPTQVRRGTFEEIMATFAGPSDITQALIPIVTGHFGLTVFRRRVFEQLKRPWFLPIPDKDGRWGEGRTDADIYFWNKFSDQGFKAALATQVVIGHGDEVVCWPKFENGKIVKVFQPLYAWHATRRSPV